MRSRIDRKTKERFKRLNRIDDDSKFVTEKGPRIVDFDEAVKSPRSLYIKEVVGSFDTDDLLTVKIMELINEAKETRQVIEETKEYLAEKHNKIKKLKTDYDVFEQQVGSLDDS